MATKWEINVPTGTYTDKSGQEKTSWLKIGKVIEKKNGKIAIKMDCTPINWDGWAELFEPKTDGEKPATKKQSGFDGEPPF